MKINTILQELREKIEELQELVNKQPQQFPQCNYIKELNYVNLADGTTEDKLKRIVQQIVEYNINIIPTPKDSQVVRSAIVKELGDKGMNQWLSIRALKEDYDELLQTTRYLYLLIRREKIDINFGAIVNLYKAAIDKYNNSLNNK
jgi:L-lactate utilization protein LutC